MFCLNKEEFLEMAEAYKKAPCPVCQSSNLIYSGYTFKDGDMAGQLQMSCTTCENDFDLHVHSLRSCEVLQ